MHQHQEDQDDRDQDLKDAEKGEHDGSIPEPKKPLQGLRKRRLLPIIGLGGGQFGQRLPASLREPSRPSALLKRERQKAAPVSRLPRVRPGKPLSWRGQMAPDEDAMRERLIGSRRRGRGLRRLALALLAGGGASTGVLVGPLVGAVAAEQETATLTTTNEAAEPATGRTSSPSSSVSTTTGQPTITTTSRGETATTEGEAETATTTTRVQRRPHGRRTGRPVSGRGRAPSGSRPRPAPPPSHRSPHRSGGGSPASPPPPAPNVPANIAKPPEVVAAHANLLAALTKGVTASAQAIELFYQIPPFLLPIYQAAAEQYGIPWEVLAAINEVETDYGNDLAVSSAGAVGWMQFMPETWLQYGVDALNAGYADPYNPVDAIFAAARYLAAAGAATNLPAAIFAYNHSQEYVESVLARARLLASYPPSAVATLTGLIDGVPPLREARVVSGSVDLAAFPAANPNSSTPAVVPTAKGYLPLPTQLVEVEGAAGSPVIASQSGRVVAMGSSPLFGRYLVLEDVYGDLLTYADLASFAARYRLPGPEEGTAPLVAEVAAETANSTAPSGPASAGSQPPVTLHVSGGGGVLRYELEEAATAAASGGKVLLYARPDNPDARAVESRLAAASSLTGGWQRLRVGAVVPQGTVLGQAQPAPGTTPGTVLRFAIRPAGDPAAINPEPIIANWVALQRALHPEGAKGGNPLVGATAQSVFLLNRGQLQRAVLD